VISSLRETAIWRWFRISLETEPMR